jgi:hypothetical protein
MHDNDKTADRMHRILPTIITGLHQAGWQFKLLA